MLEIEIKPIYGFLFIRLKGKLYRYNVDILNNEVITLIEKADIKNIVININEINFMDKIGITALKKCFKNNCFICLKENQKKMFKKVKNVKIISNEKEVINL